MGESIISKMVMTSTVGDAWGLSESGLIYLPLSTLYDYSDSAAGDDHGFPGRRRMQPGSRDSARTRQQFWGRDG